ncbi:LysR family transcriptional regulator [Bradyrhizobium sp. 147]|uniref:LysR family transcriptional regulator n=1 Tax=unclassified Bradyrhizobium TaxID=2631580 RepID=UPI001FFA4E08|nr:MULTISPECIES: LysR family transcriptional regulator [unclassified Bradyrhizobium]MCK1623557.1 LysR family transcriptional regulator [Bradyrhizobium sp. 160]MCK1681312.1 LysR family transcriptional regulator [Bradyrhizobium sp. 147]
MAEPDLRDLDVFVAIARTRNFRRAAQDIRVSVSSLSQRLRDLEERLGVRLMNRTTRSVALTEAGELLLSRVAPALRDVSEALDLVRGLREVPSGRLRINAPPPAVDLVLAPMAGPFLAAYPQIDLDIVSESGFVDIVSAGYDAGVRYGEHLAQDMVAIPLSGSQRYIVVASPDYVARRGRPKHPRDLLDHDCIRARYSSGVMHDWEFEKAGQIVKVDPPAKLISTNMNLAMRAVLDGAGIWATLDGYVHDAVKSGALVSLMEDWCEPFPGPLLYYPSRRQVPPALRAFIDFVAGWRKRKTDGS